MLMLDFPAPNLVCNPDETNLNSIHFLSAAIKITPLINFLERTANGESKSLS